MTSFEKLNTIVEKNKSILCVGLDTDIEKIPKSFPKKIESLYEFNKQVIDETKDLVCSYKINFAFYEQYGIEGFEILKNTFDYIPNDIFTIADAKRGDIGNTSKAYAKSVFEYFKADSITVSPYMGEDSVSPFLDYKDKMVFLLALTSNIGSNDFQHFNQDGTHLYEHVIKRSSQWTDAKNLGYVVGATHPDMLKEIRKIIPDNYLLIPGVGAQGGDIKAVLEANNNCPATINVSRGIIYASSGDDYLTKIREKAEYYRNAFQG